MSKTVFEMAVFTRVVECRSFAGAARLEGLTQPAVSQLVQRLEQRLGARLLQRTTRQVQPTEVGRVFYKRCKTILLDIEEAERAVSETNPEPRGLIRISVPVVFGRLHVVPVMSTLIRRFPDLRIDMALNDRLVDLVQEEIDLAVRIDSVPDSGLVMRPLARNQRFLVASPEYLKANGTPMHPDDLRRHELLSFAGNSNGADLRLTRVGDCTGPAQSVPVRARFHSNNAEAILQAAVHGLGIGWAATFAASEFLRDGHLVRVLPGHELPETRIYAAYPHARHLSAKVRVVVDHLVEAFAQPSWEA